MKIGSIFDFFFINFENMKFVTSQIAKKNTYIFLKIYKYFFFFLYQHRFNILDVQYRLKALYTANKLFFF